jgi:prolyl oligopeptidase
MRHRIPVTILITLVAASLCFAADEDPYLWMEEVENEKTLAWAKQRAQADTAVFEAVPEFTEIHGTLLEIYNSRDRIPVPEVRGSWIYNFWQDAEHVRGVWRRTFLSEFVKDDAAWEIVFDLDALAEAEGENWVWKGADCLAPAYRQCMISLSRGGADATVEREFDTVAKAFVDGGFALSEAKHRIDWMDESTLWVGTDFGEGSLTSSGYPRFAKKWQRGTPIEEAVTIFEASVDDVFAIAYSDHTKDDRYDLVNLTPEFFRGTNYLRLGGRLVKLDLPEDAQMRGFFKDQMLVSLRSDWAVGGTTYPQDALLAIDLDGFLQGSRHHAR